ncbi:MAG: hypothetical protein V4510_05220 [bacterium]
MSIQHEEAKNARADLRDPALQEWLQKLRAMHRPEEEIILLDM